MTGSSLCLYLLDKVTVLPLDRPVTVQSILYLTAVGINQRPMTTSTVDQAELREREIADFKKRRDAQATGLWK